MVDNPSRVRLRRIIALHLSARFLLRKLDPSRQSPGSFATCAAPLRLRVERRLGDETTKYKMRGAAVDGFAAFGRLRAGLLDAPGLAC
jgi:hypothetical protein